MFWGAGAVVLPLDWPFQSSGKEARCVRLRLWLHFILTAAAAYLSLQRAVDRRTCRQKKLRLVLN